MRRYSGLRLSNLVAHIEQALRECGAEILARADPTTAPFEFTVKTPTGVQRELVCYAFTANRYRRAGGPTDRHRFQIMYGSGSDRCHKLYFDPRGKKTTLLFGVHLEMDLFVGVDPKMHSPTWFPRSVEFETSDLETARTRGWHGWERERSDGRHKMRPEESLLTEAVIALRPDQFLRYVEFERLASGLDCGERCLLSDRIEKRLSQGETSEIAASSKHFLEIQFASPVSDILDLAMGRISRE